jgi:ketosteroid isomerase-like protein
MGSNEAILRDAYARYSDGEFDSVTAIFADDIVWSSPGAPNRLPTAGVWHGLSGVRKFFAATLSEWSFREFNVVEIIVQDDRRFAIRVAVEVQNNRNGARVRFEKVDLVTMKNGNCTHYAEILDTAPLERASRRV